MPVACWTFYVKLVRLPVLRTLDSESIKLDDAPPLGPRLRMSACSRVLVSLNAKDVSMSLQ